MEGTPRRVPFTLNRPSSGKLKSRQPRRKRPASLSPLRLGPAIAAASERLLQLLEDLRVLEGGDVLGDVLALRDGAQQPPHDLPRARLGQVVAEADVLGLRDGADFLPHPVAQLL